MNQPLRVAQMDVDAAIMLLEKQVKKLKIMSIEKQIYNLIDSIYFLICGTFLDGLQRMTLQNAQLNILCRCFIFSNLQVFDEID